jgi:hypothetical protein
LRSARAYDAFTRPIARGDAAFGLDPIHARARSRGGDRGLGIAGEAVHFKDGGMQVGGAWKMGKGRERMLAAS